MRAAKAVELLSNNPPLSVFRVFYTILHCKWQADVLSADSLRLVPACTLALHRMQPRPAQHPCTRNGLCFSRTCRFHVLATSTQAGAVVHEQCKKLLGLVCLDKRRGPDDDLRPAHGICCVCGAVQASLPSLPMRGLCKQSFKRFGRRWQRSRHEAVPSRTGVVLSRLQVRAARINRPGRQLWEQGL